MDFKINVNIIKSGVVIVYIALGNFQVFAKNLSDLNDASKSVFDRSKSGAYTNSLGMTFISIYPGTFVMGTLDSDADPREKPGHEVSITRPFFIGEYEVTQKDWTIVMGEQPFTRDSSNTFYRLPGMANRITHLTHPVTVSWKDAQEFIKKLNQKESGKHYRLPTEAEWEYVARAGSITRYFFGNDIDLLINYAWYGEDFVSGGTHPVGLKNPNPWGLYDIYGNAWEWVNDYFSLNYYTHSPVIDPQGPKQGNERVVRGGSWHSSADSWHSAWRKPYPENYRGISIGFRLVLEPSFEDVNNNEPK